MLLVDQALESAIHRLKAGCKNRSPTSQNVVLQKDAAIAAQNECRNELAHIHDIITRVSIAGVNQVNGIFLPSAALDELLESSKVFAATVERGLDVWERTAIAEVDLHLTETEMAAASDAVLAILQANVATRGSSTEGPRTHHVPISRPPMQPRERVLYERVAERENMQERIIEAKHSYEEDRASRDLRRDQGDTLSETDSEFEASHKRELELAVHGFETAQEAVNTVENLFLQAGLHPPYIPSQVLPVSYADVVVVCETPGESDRTQDSQQESVARWAQQAHSLYSGDVCSSSDTIPDTPVDPFAILHVQPGSPAQTGASGLSHLQLKSVARDRTSGLAYVTPSRVPLKRANSWSV